MFNSNLILWALVLGRKEIRFLELEGAQFEGGLGKLKEFFKLFCPTNFFKFPL